MEINMTLPSDRPLVDIKNKVEHKKGLHQTDHAVGGLNIAVTYAKTLV
jgi:hypothetical protein